MKRRIFTAMAVLAFSAFGMNAQTLQSTTWKAYGISFKAPAGFNVEDDSEEGYIISTPTYYIIVQLLEGEGIKRSELSQELKNIASDDEVIKTMAWCRMNTTGTIFIGDMIAKDHYAWSLRIERMFNFNTF